MKRAGFTMIELIFVIVILGILASVAVPKLIGVKESADEGLVKGFVGTLNRTVGASKWSTSLMDGNNGALRNGDNGDAAAYDITTNDTEFPSSFSVMTVDVSTCAVSTATVASGSAASTSTDSKYIILCRDGNASSAPKFWYSTDGNLTGTFPTTGLKM